MTLRLVLTAGLVATFLAVPFTDTLADEQQADCEVREHGDRKKHQSGACLFTQRQGYIDIRLNNGKTYSLSPQGNADTFRDQNGKNVKRTDASGSSQRFKWNHRTITVTFTGGSSSYSSHGGYDSYNAIPIDLREMGGTERTDSLQPGETLRYTFYARERDDLYVRVAPHGSQMYYQIFNPDGSFLLEQMTSDREYRGELWQSGEHVVEVINRGNRQVSYNIILGLD